MKNYPMHLQRQTDDLIAWVKNYWLYAYPDDTDLKRKRRMVLTRVNRLRKLLDEIEQELTEEEG